VSAINAQLTREEVAALVCATLESRGIEVVLSGGAVVSIYTENAYESFDLDFIQTGLTRKVAPAMEELGFHKEARYWKHPATRYWVEFPPGPVQVGDDIVRVFSKRPTSFGDLRLLTPTDCVMDRLAGYYHWNDLQNLDQAVAVARRHSIDFQRIEEWSSRERSTDRYRHFLTRVESA
jgi:hypothetical protein